MPVDVARGCHFMEIIGRAHRLHRALTCTTFHFMLGFLAVLFRVEVFYVLIL